MKKNYLPILALILSFYSAPADAGIEKVKSYTETVATILKLPPKETLILFDIDETLIKPTNPYFKICNIFGNKVLKLKFLGYRKAWGKEFLSLVTRFSAPLDSKHTPVEAGLPGFVKELQAKGYKVIALTANIHNTLRGKYIPKMLQENLKTHGYDFSQTFPHVPTFEMADLPSKLGEYPIYHSGILIANQLNRVPSKGDVLVKFLKKTKLQPKHVVFFDDGEIHLTSLQESLKEAFPKTTYRGYHYLPALLEKPDPDLTEEGLDAAWMPLRDEAMSLLKQALLKPIGQEAS